MTKDKIYKQLEQAFQQYCGVPFSVTQDLVPATIPDGKLYEAYVLSLVVRN